MEEHILESRTSSRENGQGKGEQEESRGPWIMFTACDAGGESHAGTRPRTVQRRAVRGRLVFLNRKSPGPPGWGLRVTLDELSPKDYRMGQI